MWELLVAQCSLHIRWIGLHVFILSTPCLSSLRPRDGNPGFVTGQTIYAWATPWVFGNPCLLRSMSSLLCEEAWHEWVFGLAQPWDVGLNVGITPNLPDQCASLAILLALKEVSCKVLSMCANQAIISKSFSWQHLEWSSSPRESRVTNIFWEALTHLGLTLK